MKAHKYWSIGAIVTMVGTFYTGYKGLKAAHKYFAFGWLVQPREEVEQGAFAASRRADDGKGFPGGQIKGKAVQNRAFAVALAQITDGDARIGRAAH